MNGDIKEVLAGIMDVMGDIFVDNANIDSITDDVINGLKRQGYQIKRIVKFKVGDTIGTDCGSCMDSVVDEVNGDTIRRGINCGLGTNTLYFTDTYDSLIDKGYRVKG